jgi:hypothetical protein
LELEQFSQLKEGTEMKKIIDSKGRIGGKVSVIDVFVILVVLILIVGLYVKFNKLDATGSSTPTETITYQIEIKEARHYALENLVLGDTIYDSEGQREIGKITAIDSVPSTKTTGLSDGSFANVSVEDRLDITLTVESIGSIEADGHYYLSQTYELNNGAKQSFYTKYYTFTGTIVDIG